MIISFETLQLQEVCLVLEIAELRLGVDAKSLIAIIADIEAFDDAAQMMAFFGEGAMVDLSDSLFLPVGTSYRMRFVAAGTKFQRDLDERVIWTSVSRLKLMEIEGCR